MIRAVQMVAAIALLMMISTSASAQSLHSTATVPFEFRMGDKVLPAGSYTVYEESQQGQGLLTLVDAHSKKLAVSYAFPVDSTSPAVNAQWLFHRYGDNYFLAEIRIKGRSQDQRLPVSRSEKLHAKQYDGTQVAVVSAP
jgi:hypothetical protein